MHEEMLTYGLKENTTNVLLHIDNELVLKGKQCGCICPNCRRPLIARRGKKNEHHFAHSPEYKSCGKGRMTALHILAQNLLRDRKTILLPPYNKKYVRKEAKTRTFKEVHLEVFSKVEDVALRPDCNCIPMDTNAPSLWVEIFCRHKVEDAKKEEIKHREQYCIEVDFRDLLTKDYSEDDVIKRLEKDSEYKEWICCPIWDNKEEKERQKKEDEDRRKREEEERLEAERLKHEQEKKDRKDYLEQLTTEWKFIPTPQNTDLIIEEIENGQPQQGDLAHPQIIDFLVPNNQWRLAITKFPKNELGLQVFYRLLRYYKVYDLTSEFEKVMWSLLQETSLSPDSKVLEEYRMALCVLGSIYTHRPLTTDDCSLARKFAENATIREEIYRILKTGKERDCFNYVEVRKKVEDYYRDKNYGDVILRIFRICFPDSETKKHGTSRYADSFDLTKEKPVENLTLFE